MNKVLLILLTSVAIVFSSCNSGNKQEALNGAHKVTVKEVLQANVYTYLNVTENGKDQWIAVTKIDAKVGETYYFNDYMEMLLFESKDLGRTFESVYFVEDLRKTLEKAQAAHPQMPDGHMSMENHDGKPKVNKAEIKIEPVTGGITIAELFANREEYKGKKVTIRGKVVKTNYGIMDKNWFHIQDGTSNEGKFDLTLTSMEEGVKVDDVVTFEGTVVLDKDFGYGYKYEILLEEAVKK
ncbi:MAG: hypothetical protein C0599_01700 [Salinivirgaceae bacterium]|nr:MAG: hypothetical protein C0599_01700 [Salinivirgaceae bacterium]